jgi:hypothetical protein
VDWIFHGEPRPYRGELIRCKSEHDDYVCPCGGIAMSSGDRMNSSTLVTVARRAWASAVMSCPA